MSAALALAERSLLVSNPNPRVGCVLVSPSGDVLGQGFTQQAGGPHAEVMALRDAASRGAVVRGATAFVTLEPCSHTGRTGPCCDALATAGVARVVAAIEDPNPLVAGRGIARLRAAGIDVQVGDGAAASRELNIGFFSRMVRAVPWVRMKMAASLDGVTALHNGESQWITSSQARSDGRLWRARACAVLTGIGTVLQDDPRLDVREAQTPRQPALVVVDSRLELPLSARLFEPRRQLIVYTAIEEPARQRALEERGAAVVRLPGPGGKVDLAAMLRDMARREINEVHVEAGHKLNGSLVRESLVDEFLVYLAPRLLGTGRGLAAIGPFDALDHGLALEFRSADPVGPDLRVLARVPGRDVF